MRVLAATTSAHKLRELRAILASLPLDVIGLDALDSAPSEPDEPHASFAANAAHKATYYARATGLLTIADDSGLCVDALDGAPGVRSKRFSGDAGLSGAELDHANNRLLLERLAGVPDERRGAHYACAAAVVRPGGGPRVCLGTCRGRILREPRGDGGFGYDPLFLLPDRGMTFAEMTASEKNRLSHRGNAFRALRALLPTLIDEGVPR